MARRYTLLDLPVLPVDRDSACGTNIIQYTYRTERQAIKDVEGLKKHIRRWRALWKLRFVGQWRRRKRLTLFERKLDLQEVLRFILDQKQLERHLRGDFAKVPNEAQAACDVLTPMPLLNVHRIASHFDVGHDLGMVRLYLDPYPDLEDKLR